MSGQTPSAGPQTGTVETPTAGPVLTCQKSHWSAWINRDNPTIGDGDFESLSPEEKAEFCKGGVISAIECLTDTDLPITSISSGEQVTCDVSDGFACRNEDNAPIPCSDYKIRYFCKCKGKLLELQAFNLCDFIKSWHQLILILHILTSRMQCCCFHSDFV